MQFGVGKKLIFHQMCRTTKNLFWNLMSKWPFTQRNDRGTKGAERGDGASQTKVGGAWIGLLGDQKRQLL